MSLLYKEYLWLRFFTGAFTKQQKNQNKERARDPNRAFRKRVRAEDAGCRARMKTAMIA
jgi:hypothetical protein